MANVEMKEKPLVNIARVEIITIETTSRTMYFDTADEGTYSATTSEGAETILRSKNRIVATNRTEDIQYGSDITLKDLIMLPDVLCVVDGGKLVYDTVDTTKITGYRPPVLGEVVKRTLFTTNIYCEEKGTDGEILGYSKFSFPVCKGKPVDFNFKDGEFMAPQYKIVSRPKKGEAPYALDFIEKLPTYTASTTNTSSTAK
ncbi:hypothetical protein [Clostridium sp. HBUAS56017]|uniref:hypothetical protein n=1 Tax=Clostridium sp. HBUAS56017 TaxID=2571128 RepID=UPI001A9B9EEB|nr:hypothetical protein [Clostridium sp. HBUAS56017]